MDQCEIILPREKTNYGLDMSNEHPINIGVDYLLIKFVFSFDCNWVSLLSLCDIF